MLVTLRFSCIQALWKQHIRVDIESSIHNFSRGVGVDLWKDFIGPLEGMN